MKKITCVLFLLTIFQSFAFGKTILKNELCGKLSQDFSFGAFAFYTNGMLFDPYSLRKGKGVKFIDTTRKSLEKKMTEFCKTKTTSTSIEDFRDKFKSTCSDECSEQFSLSKDALENDAKVVCLTICDKSKDKLDLFIEGINLGKNLSQKESSDCSKGVSDTSRSENSIKNFNSIIEHAKPSSTLQQ